MEYPRSIDQIIGLVEEQIEDKKMARKISIHLCHCFSGEKLQNIGECFGLSESGVHRKTGTDLFFAQSGLVEFEPGSTTTGIASNKGLLPAGED